MLICDIFQIEKQYKKREIIRVVKGSAQVDGAGVHLARVFGHGDVKQFDSLLILDKFDSTNTDNYSKGFPWHLHPEH